MESLSLCARQSTDRVRGVGYLLIRFSIVPHLVFRIALLLLPGVIAPSLVLHCVPDRLTGVGLLYGLRQRREADLRRDAGNPRHAANARTASQLPKRWRP